MGSPTPQQFTDVLGGLLDGRYRVEALLATGGMSTVYRGTDTRLDRRVAIKVMDPSLAADPAFADRFEREARAAARLDHPHVVEVFDQGVHRSREGEHVFLVMELVEGATLRELLDERGALPVALALSVAEPVLSALAAAHRTGLVHRDIKPENILLDRDGTVKVADFGLVAAPADRHGSADEGLFGTAGYLAPEQVARGHADARSDVYATGIVLYEMLIGRRPYTAPNALSLACRHVHEDVPPPREAAPGLAPEVDDLVLAATRRDPAARPRDGSAFLLALQRLQHSLDLPSLWVPVPHGPSRDRQTTAALPAPARRKPTRAPAASPHPLPARNRRAFAVWLAVVVLLAAATGTAGWWLGAGRYTAVPVVTGLDRATATRLLSRADLEPAIRRTHHNAVPPGEVIATRPRGGDRAVRGTQVTVLLSVGRPVVPDLTVGAPPAEVEQAIREAGLRPVRKPGATEFSSSAPQGTVVALRPPAGTVLPVGSRVTLVISRGPAPLTPAPSPSPTRSRG